MTKFKVKHEKQWIMLMNVFIQDPRLSFEGKGYYAMVEADAIKLEEVPQKILQEFKDIGYIMGDC